MRLKGKIKEIPNDFPSRIVSYKHAGCLRHFRQELKDASPYASVFSFPNVEQDSKCLDDTILHGEPLGICFIK